MRGLPSCGKSHASQKLAAEGGVRIEFDEYFYTQVGNSTSSYDWSRELMQSARAWNFQRIKAAVDAGESPIIVDSDNLVGPVTKQYVAYAFAHGYEVAIKEPNSPWWRTIRELLADKAANADALQMWAKRLANMSKTTHRVPIADILGRINRWSNVTVEHILSAA